MTKGNELVLSYSNAVSSAKTILAMTKWINHIEMANWNRRVKNSMRRLPEKEKQLSLISEEMAGLVKFCIVHAPAMQSLEVCRAYGDFSIEWSKFLVLWGVNNNE